MKWFQLSLCAVITCVCLCSAQTQKLVPKLSTELFSTSIGNFSLLLMYHTANEINDNIITSPLTVWSLLAALAEGASGETLHQLLKHLRIKKIDRENTRHQYAELAKHLIVNTSTISLERNSALFADSSSPVEPDYVALLRKSYLTDVRSVNFKNTGPATKLINDYVSNATHGKINEVVFENDLRDAKLILTNAIYFKGQWTVPFNLSETNIEPFYNTNGEEIGKVNMMHGRAVYPYVNIPELEARIIQLPYGDQQRLSMFVILPHPDVSLTKMFLNFKNVPLSELFLKLQESLVEYEGEEVECWIPRFKITTDVSMVKPLTTMGISDIFDPKYAEFPKISKQKVYLSQIFHKAQIEVTEEGTVAAAVTVAELTNRMTASKFNANRPFVFLIAEKHTNMFVFAGIYSKPSLF